MSRRLSVEYLQEIVAALDSRDVEIQGREAIEQYLGERFKRIPDMRWEPVDDYVVDETRAVSVWIVKGTENGKPIESRGVDLWEFRGDRVLNKDTYWKLRTS